MPIRPMLAAKAPEDLDALRFPLYASPKLDGIRCLIKDGQAVSRTLKPIRNRFIQSILSNPKYEGLDGELIVGEPTDPNCMQHTNSGVMSAAGEPDFRFFVFDYWNRGKRSYKDAYDSLILRTYNTDYIKLHHQEEHLRVSTLEAMEQSCLSAGYEGIVTRDPHSPYKFNRSTQNQQWLLKIKRFQQDEAIVMGYEQLHRNMNEATISRLGLTERATDQHNKVPVDMLGALVCKTPRGVAFNIGSGFTEAERKLLWAARKSLPGRIVTFKHFTQQGVLNAPRTPIFVSFRHPEDM